MSLNSEAVGSPSLDVLSPCMDRGELLLTGLLKKVRRLIVTELMRGRLQYFKRDPGFQVLLGFRECFQFLIRRHHRLIAVHFAFLALRICPGFLKEAGPVEVQIGREVRLIEGIDKRRPALRNVSMAND